MMTFNFRLDVYMTLEKYERLVSDFSANLYASGWCLRFLIHLLYKITRKGEREWGNVCVRVYLYPPL